MTYEHIEVYMRASLDRLAANDDKELRGITLEQWDSLDWVIRQFQLDCGDVLHLVVCNDGPMVLTSRLDK
jgi:hypothetical protein